MAFFGFRFLSGKFLVYIEFFFRRGICVFGFNDKEINEMEA